VGVAVRAARPPSVSEEPGLLRTAYEARGRELAKLRAALADTAAAAEGATADAASHEREAAAQRERAERAEREAVAQRERADALEAELTRRRSLVARLRGR